MSDDLAIRRSDTIPLRNMDDLARLSEMFARSGYFTDAREAAQVGVKILAGREMGIGPFASVNGFHIISGRPAMGANLMAAAVKASGKYDYRVREMGVEACRIEFFQAGESIGVSEFTIADARKAGTKNLDKFARNMLFARAMSNGVRWFCPDVFMGAAVYTPEELGATVNDDGDVVDVPSRASEARERPAPAALPGEDAPEPVEAHSGAPEAQEGTRKLGPKNGSKLHARIGAVLGISGDEEQRAVVDAALEREHGSTGSFAELTVSESATVGRFLKGAESGEYRYDPALRAFIKGGGEWSPEAGAVEAPDDGTLFHGQEDAA